MLWFQANLCLSLVAQPVIQILNLKVTTVTLKWVRRWLMILRYHGNIEKRKMFARGGCLIVPFCKAVKLYGNQDFHPLLQR